MAPTDGPTRAERPLVAVHTWVDETDHYTALSAAMGGVPIHSILPPLPDDGPMPRRVEEWVAHSRAHLVDLGLTPPYRIIGWSFGGVVALELARALRDEGAPVEFVGLIDSTRPRLLPASDSEFVWHHLGAAAAMSAGARGAYLRQKLGYLLVRRYPRLGGTLRAALVRLGYRRGRDKPYSVRPTDPAMVSVHTSYLNYRGAAVDFPVHLYATEPSLRKAREPALRWVPTLHAGFELQRIAGEHFTLFEPDAIDSLATALARSLARID